MLKWIISFNDSYYSIWQVSDEDEFDDGYGSDLMGDEEDRANLMAMNELQREMILAERAEKRDLDRERLRNAKLLRQHQQASQQVGHLATSLAWCHTFSDLLTLAVQFSRPHIFFVSCFSTLNCTLQALQPRASTRAKQKGGAKTSAMAELVAAKAARAERTTALDRCR